MLIKVSLTFVSLLCFTNLLFAQTPRKIWPEITLSTGAASISDEKDTLDHFLLGGTAGFYLKNRLLVGPQIWYLNGPGAERHIILTGYIAYDVKQSERTRIYLIGGSSKNSCPRSCGTPAG